jgi:hypothetical protein
MGPHQHPYIHAKLVESGVAPAPPQRHTQTHRNVGASVHSPSWAKAQNCMPTLDAYRGFGYACAWVGIMGIAGSRRTRTSQGSSVQSRSFFVCSTCYFLPGRKASPPQRRTDRGGYHGVALLYHVTTRKCTKWQTLGQNMENHFCWAAHAKGFAFSGEKSE